MWYLIVSIPDLCTLTWLHRANTLSTKVEVTKAWVSYIDSFAGYFECFSKYKCMINLVSIDLVKRTRKRYNDEHDFHKKREKTLFTYGVEPSGRAVYQRKNT